MSLHIQTLFTHILLVLYPEAFWATATNATTSVGKLHTRLLVGGDPTIPPVVRHQLIKSLSILQAAAALSTVVTVLCHGTYKKVALQSTGDECWRSGGVSCW